jgi:hypothetical protein
MFVAGYSAVQLLGYLQQSQTRVRLFVYPASGFAEKAITKSGN